MPKYYTVTATTRIVVLAKDAAVAQYHVSTMLDLHLDQMKDSPVVRGTRFTIDTVERQNGRRKNNA